MLSDHQGQTNQGELQGHSDSGPVHLHSAEACLPSIAGYGISHTNPTSTCQEKGQGDSVLRNYPGQWVEADLNVSECGGGITGHSQKHQGQSSCHLVLCNSHTSFLNPSSHRAM